ncbi:mycothiol synthase [Thalassiella azotivora]
MGAPAQVRAHEQLSAADGGAVARLVREAQAEDGVSALNEAASLRLAPSPHPQASTRHLVAGPADAPVGYAQVSGLAATEPYGGAPAGAGPEAELVVAPAHRRQGAGRALLDEALALAGPALRLWAHGDLPAARGLAASAGFVPVRTLLRMRRPADQPLPDPQPRPGAELRTFRPGADDEAWLALNARAFADHPEQGRWTAEDLAARLRSEWFDPAGFFLAVDEDDGRLLGYHWTKLEPADDQTPVGEVYVVGVDPAAQGRRLGSWLTLVGLHHLHERGVHAVDLYVEADNGPALAVYRRLGFTEAARDTRYALP